MDAAWDDLRVFLAVARHGSLSAAGAVLGLDPATVGRRVARLEAVYATPLFLRSPQGYALSETGERLVSAAEEAEQAMMQAEDVLRGQTDRMMGTIRIGAPDGCANFLLPRILTRIQQDQPDLDMQVVALPRVFNLSRREADMAIGVSAPGAGRMTCQKITDYTLCLAASPAYLKQAPPLITLSDLQHHRIIGYIPEMIFDKELDYLDRLGVRRLAIASNSASVQTQLARAGAGITAVHDFALIGDSGLVTVLPEAFGLTRSFYLIRHADDLRVRRLTRFAELLVREMRREMHDLRKSLTDAGSRGDP